MASGHVNRTQRPNTWLHRPSLQREDSPCQLGAVHTWPLATDIAAQANVGCWGKTGTGWSAVNRRSDECAPTLASQHRQDWRIVRPQFDWLRKSQFLISCLNSVVFSGEPARTFVYAAV